MEWFRDYHYDEDWDAVMGVGEGEGGGGGEYLLSMMKKYLD